MAFKTVNSLEADNTISLGGTNRKTGKTNPTSIEGYYLGSRQVQDNKKKSGVSFIYIFQTSKGNVGVWGKTDMDRKMAQTPAGVMTRVTATGTRPTPNGDMYTFKVEVDSDNTIEVQAPTASIGRQVDDFDDEPTQFASSNDLDDEDEEQNEALRQAEEAAAARKARTAALLKKKA
jgi:hypothetical protein